jgi:hypothetical protein
MSSFREMQKKSKMAQTQNKQLKQQKRKTYCHLTHGWVACSLVINHK